MRRSAFSGVLKVLFAATAAAAVFSGLVLTGCSDAAPAEECQAQAGQSQAQGEKGPELKSLLVYVGAASKPPTEEAAKLFEEKTGVRVDLVFGGSGTVLSQMQLNRNGDLYFPGSSDFMEKAKREGLVYPETESKIVYLVNAINVQKGNPKGIKGLEDLLRPGLKIAIANPETVCVGLYAAEIVDKAFTAEERQAFRENLINYTESCDKTAAAISLKTVDAVIGWSVFEHWDPDNIESVPLKPDQIARIGYIPIAVSAFTRDRQLSQQFIDFLNSEEGRAVFKKYHYFTTPEEAEEYIGEEKPIGGEYELGEDWIVR